MKRKSLRGSVCAVARALDVIGDWWSLLIIYEAIAGRNDLENSKEPWVRALGDETLCTSSQSLVPALKSRAVILAMNLGCI